MLRVMPQDWGEDQAVRVAQEVRRLRDPRSAQWLSDRTAELGYCVTRSVIADLENGRRRYVTTAELCALAWALKVPPIRLLYPELPDGAVEVVPGVEKPSIEAAMWFSGELAYIPEFPDPKDRQPTTDELQETLASHQGAELVRLARERVTLESQISSLSNVLARMKDQSVTQSLISQIESAQSRINAINERLRGIHGAVVGDGR
jgi:hypothetical protein